MNDYVKEKLEKQLKECEKHIKRMESAAKKMSAIMPLDPQKYFNLTEDEIEHIDQFLFRFSKLQDAIGRRLFKTVLIYLGEYEVEAMPFIDILNRLEQLRIIKDREQWLILREIRNNLSHEYEDNEETPEMINQIYDKRAQLIEIYEVIFSTLHR